MSVFIVRTFIRIREMALTNETLSRKVSQLERRVGDHDEILMELITEISKLIEEPKARRKKQAIGFINFDTSKNKHKK